jgi:hypothetical protein
MLKKFAYTLTFFISWLFVEGLFSLLFFWAVMYSYSVWLPDYSLSSSIAVVLAAQRIYHGPSLLEIGVLGLLSPALALLPLSPFLALRKKLPSWFKFGLFFVWLGEIFGLGWLTPHLGI